VFALFAFYHSQKGKVFAFEPLPDNYSLLKENVSLNKANNVIPLNFGICGKRSKRKLYLNEKNTGGHSIIKKEINSVDIKCVTLKNVFKEFGISYCDFMKIDCEGAEYEILMKTPKNILKRIGKISLEHHNFDPKHSVNDLKKHLFNSGFDVVVKENMVYAKR
jgi:FkbM family methyltransferase